MRRVMTLLAVLGCSAAAIAAEVQTFDSQADYDANFTIFGPADDPTNFTTASFRDTNEAGGAAAGEFGGMFARAVQEIKIYDTTDIDYSLEDQLHFQAKLRVKNINFDGGMYLGFVNASPTGDNLDDLGMFILEPSDGLEFRTGPNLLFQDEFATDLQDNANQNGTRRGLRFDQPLMTTFDYDPDGGAGEGQVVWRLFDETGLLLEEAEWDLDFGQRNAIDPATNQPVRYNAFGVFNGMGTDGDVGQQMEAWFDDLCYGTDTDCDFGGGNGFTPRAGDANSDREVNTVDIVQILAANKFETGQPAVFAEGDFDGDGVFATSDIVAMLAEDLYETGPYAALRDAAAGDGTDQVVINYNSADGNFSVTAKEAITSISLESASGIFTGTEAQNLGGPFDVDSDPKIFKAVFGDNFSEVDFGPVADAGLAKDFLLNDLSASGSLAAGGTYGPDVQLNYIIPEPSTVLLLVLGVLGLLHCGQRRR